jgi:hypothetical protein
LALCLNHRIALDLAQTVQQASEPYPLVHITPWSPSIAPGEALASTSVASRRNSFIDSPLLSGDRPLVVFAASRQKREDEARDLVGHGYGDSALNLGYGDSALNRSARRAVSVCLSAARDGGRWADKLARKAGPPTGWLSRPYPSHAKPSTS